MKSNRAGLMTANSLLLLTASFLLMMASATPLMAQGARQRAAEANARRNTNALAEWQRTHMAEVVSKQFEKKRISLFPQIKEDFTRLQVVNNGMMRQIYADQPLDYKLISDSIGEIKKRANRLKTNLMLPESPAEEQSLKLQAAAATPAAGQVKNSLLALDTLIMGFVTNPLFQKPGVIDAKLSAKASRDLNAIIEFTGGIKKEVARLSKFQGNR